MAADRFDHSHRGQSFVEEAEILSHDGFDGDQWVMRVAAPLCAAAARPGQFAHLTCHPLRPLRRPISIMRTDPAGGWVEFLYKAVGDGTRLLARRCSGETLSLLGPIGRPFTPTPGRRRPLLIGGGVGMPPMIFLADRLRLDRVRQPLVLLGSEVPFPFRARPSRLLLPDMPDGVIAAMPLLDDWEIPSRLASLSGFPGVFKGYITQLARAWLDTLDSVTLDEVEIFACGPHPMLEAVAALARELRVPCQVSLEEYMACGIGGCAGCVVELQTESGPAMKRVCVDGPVFDAAQVFGIV